MSINKARVQELLQRFEFKRLFIEEIGWDNHDAVHAVEVDGTTYILEAVAEKRGVQIFACKPNSAGEMPDYNTRMKIDTKLRKIAHEHLIIYYNAEKTQQRWQWVHREPGKAAANREWTYSLDQTGEALIQKLNAISFSLSDEENLNLLLVVERLKEFDKDRVSKKFYDVFKKELAGFIKFIEGLPDGEIESWYASVIINRLMFIYFIQKKGFLDGDPNYLVNKLRSISGRDNFYREFLCPLFFEGFAKKKEDRSPDMNKLLGKIPYLNGGLFLKHQIEEHHGDTIQIPDKAFERIFRFFDQYQWHLDERPMRADNEINPDVLGYIFEKYINQKQMGAYYTKEDITDYITKNTVIPYLFDSAEKKCKIAFEGEESVWKLLQNDPDRYIYEAVRRGVTDEKGNVIPESVLPDFVQLGMRDPKARMFDKRYNLSEAELYDDNGDKLTLPTETWREYVDRRKRCLELREKLERGQIRSINDLITYNLNIRQFTQDVIEQCEGPELLRAFWHSINGRIPEKSNETFEQGITILDPACGSGAFLFAALNILEPLYEACLKRMEAFLEELDQHEPDHHSEKYRDFRKILDRTKEHPNRRYFILKSIIVNNLYGVDIMDEAVEICKLRFFLKLVAQIEDPDQIEPLPDIDFNVRAGNTLVGFATYEEVEKTVTKKLDYEQTMPKIEAKAEEVAQLYRLFQRQQMALGGEVSADSKEILRDRLSDLEQELNAYLAGEYGIDASKPLEYQRWLTTHKPFHWFVVFYGIMSNGGFDVIIGNPPYVEYSKIRNQYTVFNYLTLDCGNLYPMFVERGTVISNKYAFLSMIIPISAFANKGMGSLQDLVKKYDNLYVASFHQRPAQLFEGVLQRLSIFILRNSPGRNLVKTTSVIRWFTEAREYLFSNYHYCSCDQMKQLYIIKIGNKIERSIIDKFYSHARIEEYLSNKRDNTTNNFIAYRTAGGGYWWTFLNSQFKTESLSNKLAVFQKEIDARVIMTVLNSTLFWWYYFISYDLFNLKDYMIFSFRFNYPQDKSIVEKLIQLSVELENTLLSNAIKYLIRSKTRGNSFTFKYQNQLAKPILDKIDVILAEHYGLTNEELDFIINYDIKYRMGLNTT